jgi:hypothetical protein
MTADKVRDMLRSQPFRPFKMVLIDGREFRVNHPEFVALVPGDRTVLHFTPAVPESHVTFIDLLHVSTLEPLNGRPPPRRGKPPPRRGKPRGGKAKGK